MISVAIIDDHYVVRLGIRTIVEMDRDLTFAGEAADATDAAAFVSRVKPDVVLLDIRMPDRDGLDALADILMARPEQKVVMLTTSDTEEEVHRALTLGAKGYLLKDRDSNDICRAVKTVAEGGRFIPAAVREIFNRRQMMDDMTPREREVLGLVIQGCSNEVIAQSLGMAETSVKVHMKHILSKFGVSNRTELVIKAFKQGFAKR